MAFTTVMAVVMLIWCGVTLIVRGPANPLPSAKPELSTKVEYQVEEVDVDRVTHEKLESPRKVWELAACGAIPFIKIGSIKRYRRADLEAWVEKGCPTVRG